MRLYLVGGAIRDMLLGRLNSSADRDFLAADATEADLLALWPTAKKVGRRFPVYVTRGGEATLRDLPPSPGDPSGILSDLVTERDLTINALALDDSGRLYAHPRALSDLKDKILRPASADAFRRDPLRTIRAARFAALFPDFSPAPELLAALRETVETGLIAQPAPERVGAETLKALAAPMPSRFLRLLREASALAPWFAELAPAPDIPAGPLPWHPENLFEHVCQVMDRLAGDPLRVWMGLCHDLGKLLTPAAALPSHHGHDASGEPMAQALGERLRLPSRYIKAGVIACRRHMTAGRYPELRPGTRVDILEELDRAGLLDDLFALLRADRGEGVPEPPDLLPQARADLETIRAVRLKPEDASLGPAAGAKLRSMRGMALKEKNRRGTLP